MKLRFTEDDSAEANCAWGANCGPHAVAAALMLTLDQVRPLFAPKFEEKFRERGYGFTNPTMMGNALALAGVHVKLTKALRTQELCEGINRIQWEGKWLNPGVPPIVAYGHTHWVAAAAGHVFCTAAPLIQCDWLPERKWRARIATVCLQENFTGWHVTHHYAFPVKAKVSA